MFPTMELLLRHAINYLNMKKSKAVKDGGVIDNEGAFLEDMDKISLDEQRAVLSIHMLCYVLDGSLGFTEMELWKTLCGRVEEVYEMEKAAFARYTPEEIREYIIKRKPFLASAVMKVSSDDPELEKKELAELLMAVPRPEHVAVVDGLVPRVVCQQFRSNIPVSTKMIMACFDPDENQTFRATTLAPNQIFAFTFNEFAYKLVSILTKQV